MEVASDLKTATQIEKEIAFLLHSGRKAIRIITLRHSC
jgi:hypothetical protein